MYDCFLSHLFVYSFKYCKSVYLPCLYFWLTYFYFRYLTTFSLLLFCVLIGFVSVFHLRILTIMLNLDSLVVITVLVWIH